MSASFSERLTEIRYHFIPGFLGDIFNRVRFVFNCSLISVRFVFNCSLIIGCFRFFIWVLQIPRGPGQNIIFRSMLKLFRCFNLASRELSWLERYELRNELVRLQDLLLAFLK